MTAWEDFDDDPDERDPIREALRDAAYNGDEGRIRALLAGGAPEKWAMDEIVDCEHRVGHMLRSMIERGIDIHATYGSNGPTLLAVAAGRGDTDLVQHLLDRGADPAQLSELGYSPVHYAVRSGHFAIACLLASRAGHPSDMGQIALEAFHGAVHSGNPADLEAILDASPEIIDDDLEIGCGWHVSSGSITLEERDRDDDSRLRLVRIIEERLQARRGLSIADLAIERILVLRAAQGAARAGNAALFKHIIARGCLELTAGEAGELLEEVVRARHLDVAAALVDIGASQARLDASLDAIATYFDLMELVTRDFARPAPVAREALPMACLLLDAGAAADPRPPACVSLLMLAAACHELPLMRLLLARGADPNLADPFGRTPVAYARRAAEPPDRDAQRAAVQLLFEHGARAAAWTEPEITEPLDDPSPETTPARQNAGGPVSVLALVALAVVAALLVLTIAIRAC